jgi:hypothetical protein
VFCRLPPGSVQPAATAGLAGPPVAAGLAGPPVMAALPWAAVLAEPPAVPAWALAAAVVKQPGALELLVLLLPQPPTASPAAAIRDRPATAGRQRVPPAPLACPPTVLRSTPMAASLPRTTRPGGRWLPAAPTVLTALI